jgi:histone acetyltransferase MCC1
VRQERAIAIELSPLNIYTYIVIHHHRLSQAIYSKNMNSIEMGTNETESCMLQPTKCMDLESCQMVIPLLPSNEILDSIVFRSLEPKDRSQIQRLHEEWFPVSYKEEFYDDLVHHRMVNSGEDLVTYAAVQIHNFQNTIQHEDCQQPISSHDTDSILACLVGSMMETSQLQFDTADMLLSDSRRYCRVFYIMTLGTVREYRKLGLATKLLRHVMDRVEQDPQCGALYLHVITYNAAAIRFYEKLGFYRVTELKDYYRIDDKSFNCFVYAKYYHGNQGRVNLYYLVTSFLSSLWNRVMEPFMPARLEHDLDRSR